MTEIHVSREVLRRFLVKRLALESFQSLADVAEAVDRLQFVQMDSISVCGRMHDLILWPRVRGYHPADLSDYLYGTPRRGFEFYFPNLSVLRVADYPFFVPRMRASQEPEAYHWLTPEEAAIEDLLMAQAHAEPIRTRSLDAGHGHTTSPWGTKTTVAARVVNKLWHHGKLHIQRREGFEKWYSPTSLVAPELADHHVAPPNSEEAERHLLLLRLKSAGLFRLKPHEIEFLGSGQFCHVRFEGAKRLWYGLASDVEALVEAEHFPDSDTAMLVAPLDPLVHDRHRLEDLFEFEYRWEVYTPVAKRRWGYYVFPILWRSQIVGRLDPKFDAATKVLQIISLRLEPAVDESELAEPLADRIKAYAQFLGAKRIQWGLVEPKRLKALLKARCGGR